jgi:RNA polymerase sigma-70 factor (ECF subfamily)
MQESLTWDWTRLRKVCDREVQSVLRGPDREDAVQEALSRAWRKRHSCQQPHAPEAWVAQIARREALRLVSRRRPHLELDPFEHEMRDATDGPEAGVGAMDLRRALRVLPAEDRRLIGLRYVADLTQPQVAEALSVPEGTAKIRLHRARKRLRDMLEES